MNPTLPFKRQSLVVAISMAFAGAGLAGRALAQAAPAPDRAASAVSTQVVEVTAQGRKENPAKIPYNITAVNGGDLNDRHVTDQNELLREVAGASVVDHGYRNSGVVSGVTLRGMNVNDSSLGDYQTSAIPTVSTYVDQTPIFANFLIKDVERVEVLRGPQGTLYGSGSLGGTLRYITRAPELGRFSGRVETSLAHEDGSGGLDKTLDLVLNVPLADMFALRFSGGLVRDAGVVDYKNIYKLDANGVPVAPNGAADPAATYTDKKDADTTHIDYGRLSLLFKPSASFSATLTHQEQRDEIGGRRQPTRGDNGDGVPYGKYENGSIQLEPSSRKVAMTSLEMELDLGFATLTSASAASNQSGHSLSENTGFYAQNGWLQNFYYNYPRPMAQADRTYSDKSKTEELRLISAKGGVVDYVVGAFYEDQDLGASQRSYLKGIEAWCSAVGSEVCPAAFTNENDFLYDRAQKYKDQSVYGELTWPVTPHLRVTGGMRHFDTKLTNTSTLGIPIWGDLFPTTTTRFDQAAKGNLFKGNIGWDIADKQLLYGTVSQGFRHGGSNAVPTIGFYAESANYQSFAPDRDTNYEAGLKGAVGGVNYSVAAYLIDWKNIQLDIATPTWGFYAAQNGGKARSQGLEAEVSGRIGGGVGYKLSYGYVNARITDAVYAAGDGTTLIAPSGTRLPGTARNTFSAGLDHIFWVNDTWSWTNRINAYYQGPTENSISQSPKYKATWPGFSLWGASSTLACDKLSLTLFVKNLFNSAGVSGGFLEQAMGTAPAAHYDGNGSKVFISQPRTIGMTVAYEF